MVEESADFAASVRKGEDFDDLKDEFEDVSRAWRKSAEEIRKGGRGSYYMSNQAARVNQV